MPKSRKGVAQRRRAGGQEITSTTLEETTSPFPPAAEIKAFEEAIPGSGIRLLEFVERQQKRSFDAHDKEIELHHRRASSGQILIFISVIVALSIAGYVGVQGNWVAASVIGFVPTALVASLIYIGKK